MTTFVFPGQGSQCVGMGSELFDEFHDLTKLVDQELGYSIKQLCLEDPNHQLDSTQFTQPAMYVVNAFSYLKKMQNSPKPNYVAGHSLGEYNALFAADVFDFTTGLTLVKKRGELMSRAKNGGMTAIVGLAKESIEITLLENNATDIDIANLNSPTQTVIAGPKASLASLTDPLKKAGAKLIVPLPVSAAFHSRYLQDITTEFSDFLQAIEFQSPTIPVIANCSANPYQSQPEDIKNTLIQQITHSVRWTESIEYLINQGETDFAEIGPGQVLTKLIRQIKK